MSWLLCLLVVFDAGRHVYNIVIINCLFDVQFISPFILIFIAAVEGNTYPGLPLVLKSPDFLVIFHEKSWNVSGICKCPVRVFKQTHKVLFSFSSPAIYYFNNKVPAKVTMSLLANPKPWKVLGFCGKS